MKENSGKMKGKTSSTLIGFGAVFVAAVVIAISAAVAVKNTPSTEARTSRENHSKIIESTEESSEEGEKTDANEEFLSPVATLAVINNYGFYFNKTLGSYYLHEGIDVAAETGTEVYAVQDGLVESVFTSDILTGTEIVIDHGNGVKSHYECVEAVEGLKAGDSVKRGDTIAYVAEASGKEYKDGAHLHFSVSENSAFVDPSKYFTWEEK